MDKYKRIYHYIKMFLLRDEYKRAIGDNVIIAAGSLVTGNIPDGSVVGGVPAKVIGGYDSYREKIVDYTDGVPWKGDKKTKDCERVVLD
ncbi:hypothetical protein CE91St62_32340 [Lachnospiraceae bacterium]|uniref:acyltransferase n=1 Tax=Extibacter sp. GGCC_0201 TaxID=2731209 RepID=UPI001AA12003|nr:hypothetical protein [Extibacter sp. GGCC_0201]MBO1721998.1 hypothetical protein [Extibacter sp. GGCC_0201]BDF35172.1 hypothetical protein CE91St61_32470 [Lachnospiraceae bacterium]BDF39173.1 hypothetical protein CE91St62_32340 [Lachnospiraceae bacterium]